MDKMITQIITSDELINKLHEVGLRATDSCLVHTALSSFGYLPGGVRVVVSTLQQVLNAGNVVMPAQSSESVDPAT